MTAVIWTDVIQMFIYVAGAALSFVLILQQIPGGWQHVVEVAAPLGKFQVFDFHFAFSRAFFANIYTFWAGILGGCFLTTATHGTDQLIVQRLLSAKNQTDSRKALFASWLVIVIQFTMFLVIGVMLFVFYSDRRLAPPGVLDKLYPQFIWQFLPPVVAGVVIAAILAAAMANISAALNALASTTMVDFFQRYSPGSEARSVRLSRMATVAWGLVLVGIGLLARRWGSVLEAGLAIASIPFGALLGVFLLGTLTRRVRENDAIAGMITGLVCLTYLRFPLTIDFHAAWPAILVLHKSPVAWTWYVVIGTVITFVVGYLASLLHHGTEEISA